MSTTTPNLTLVKNDDDEGGWGGDARSDWDILDLLYSKGVAAPNTVRTGNSNEIFYQTLGGQRLWFNTVKGSNVDWVDVGQLVSPYLKDTRNVYNIAQVGLWQEVIASSSGGSFAPDQDDDLIAVDFDANIAINIPTGGTVGEGQIIVMRILRTTASVVALNFNVAFNFPFNVFPPTPINGEAVIVTLLKTLAGTWDAQFTSGL